MDVKDKKILFALDKNARSPYSDIAKSARISQETARYRVNKLTEEGIIQQFLTIFDNTKLGFSHYQILFKLQNVNEIKKQEIVSFFVENTSVIWIGNLEGAYDLAIILTVKSHIELQKLFDEFQKFNPFIMKKVISIVVRSEFLSREYLKGDINREVKKIGLSEHHNNQLIMIPNIDKIDKQICAIMANNARISSVDIAKKIGLSSDATIQRIKKLEKSIIAGYIIILNQEKISQLHYKVLLYLNNATEAKTQALLNHVRSNNRAIAIVQTLAEWDYEIDLEVESIQQLKGFTMEITNKFSDIIRDYGLLQIISMPKYTFFPESEKKLLDSE